MYPIGPTSSKVTTVIKKRKFSNWSQLLYLKLKLTVSAWLGDFNTYFTAM